MSGDSLLSLLRGNPSLIGGAFQVILEVHGDDSGQEIVHHNNTDILTACLNAIQSIKLRQQGALVLVYILKGRGNRQKKLDTEIRRKTSPYLRIVAVIVTHSKQTPTSHSIHTHHEVSRQQFLEKLCLFVLDSLDDKLIITGDVEEGTAGSGVRQLDQRLITQRILPERDR